MGPGWRKLYCPSSIVDVDFRTRLITPYLSSISDYMTNLEIIKTNTRSIAEGPQSLFNVAQLHPWLINLLTHVKQVALDSVQLHHPAEPSTIRTHLGILWRLQDPSTSNLFQPPMRGSPQKALRFRLLCCRITVVK